MNLDGKQERKEICISYLSILENLPLTFDEMFSEDFSGYLLSAEMLMDIFIKVFPFPKIRQGSADLYLEITRLYKGSKRIYLNEVEKKAYFVFSKFFFKSSSFVLEIFNDYKREKKDMIEVDRVIQYVKSSNKELGLSTEQVEELMVKLFNLTDVTRIKIDLLINFYDQKLRTQMFVEDYLNFCLNSLEEAYEFVRMKVSGLFEKYSTENVLNFKEFKELLMKHFLDAKEEYRCMEYFMLVDK